MKRTLLKALVMLEKWENSWFLNGGFHESIDGQLIDVKALRVNMQDFDATLLMVVKQAPDVLLLESTLTPHFVSRMAIQLRNKLPNLPILLLPDIHGAVELEGPPEVGGKQSRLSAAAGNNPIAADTIAQTLRYTHGHLGLQRTLLQMALRDDLTGLHNRRGFMALAARNLRWARDARQNMLMFFADLDGLKWINDHYGHSEGDRAISLAAACIEQTFRKFDVTGRLSGDEFVALIQEEPGGSAEAICQRLHSNLADCTGAENRYKLSLSVGVAHFDPDKPATLQDLMRQADTALYAQKRKRKNRACVSNDLTAANSEESARAGGAKRPAFGESTAAASHDRWLSMAVDGAART
ncbi:MAG TPA: GGDEF domain-containing protein [Steroidobacteraceae bacterium]|jgi:diguanylate cyclase (GGDEF)-like protein